MSKKHTPTEQFKSIQMDLTNIRVQVRSNASTVDIDKSLYNLDLNIANKLDKFQNNHDRLVEALEKTKEVLQGMLDGNVCSHAGDDIIKQLLTELES